MGENIVVEWSRGDYSGVEVNGVEGNDVRWNKCCSGV